MENVKNVNNDQDQHTVNIPLTEVDTDVEDLFEDLEEKNNIDDEQFYESNDCTYDSLFLNKSSFERPESLANNDFLLKDLNQDQKDKIEQIRKLQSPLISNAVNPIAVTEAMPAMSSSKRHFVEPNDMDAEVVETLEAVDSAAPIEALEADDAVAMSEAVDAVAMNEADDAVAMNEAVDAVAMSEAVDAVAMSEAVDAIEEVENSSNQDNVSNNLEKILLNSNDIKTQKIVSTSEEAEKRQQETQQETETKSKTMPMFKEIGSLRRDKTIDSPVQKRDNQNNLATKSSATNQSYTKSSATNQSYKTANNLTKSSDSIPTQMMRSSNQATSEHKIESGFNSSIGTIEKTHPKLVLPIVCIVLAVALVIILSLFSSISSNYDSPVIYATLQKPVQDQFIPKLIAEGIVLGEERVQFAPHTGEITFLVNPGSSVKKDDKVATLTNSNWEKQNKQNKEELMALLEEWQATYLEFRYQQVTKNKNTSSFDNIIDKFKISQQKCWEQINTENIDITQELENLKKTLHTIKEPKLYILYYKQKELLQKINDCIENCQKCKRETIIRADYDGTIQKFSYTKDVKYGSPLFTIVESSPKYVRVKARKEYYSKLLSIMENKQNFSVSIGVTAKNSTNGSISNINLRSDHTKETLCEVIVKLEPAKDILNGSIALIRLPLEKKENCLQLPKSAIIRSEDCDHVFYYVLVANHINGNQYQVERKEVTLGLSNAENVEIITGLSDDEFVVTNANIVLSAIPNDGIIRVKSK